MLAKTVSLIMLCAGIMAFGAPVKVFILSGQSNMVGAGKNDDIRNVVLPTNVKIFTCLDGGTCSSNWGGIVLPSGGTFGPEVGIAKQLSAFYPGETVYLLKAAWGGTGLYASKANPAPNEYWLTNNSIVYPWFRTSISKGINALRTIGLAPQLKGMFWMQGETDAMGVGGDDGGAGFAVAQRYDQSLSEFFSLVRTGLAVSGLPVIYGKIQNAPIVGGDWLASDAKKGYWGLFANKDYAVIGTTFWWGKEVQYRQFKAQNQIAYSYCVEATSKQATWPDDPFHYNSNGSLAVGVALGQGWIDYISGKSVSRCVNPKFTE